MILCPREVLEAAHAVIAERHEQPCLHWDCSRYQGRDDDNRGSHCARHKATWQLMESIQALLAKKDEPMLKAGGT